MVAVLPGVAAEVKNVLPTVLKAISQLRKAKVNCQTIVSVAHCPKTFVEQLVAKCKECGAVIGGETGEVSEAADVAVTSIGTVH